MSSVSSILPRPKNSDGISTHRSSSKSVVVTKELTDEQKQLLRESSGIPPYGQREGLWRPKSLQDFGDGGSYPEIPVAQYPIGMGRGRKRQSKALSLEVDEDGKVKYDAIAKQGHSENRIIQTSYNELIPLRQRANAGDVNLFKPAQEEVDATTERTKEAIEKILNGKLESTKPQAIAKRPNEPTYVRYTPSNMMGESSNVKHRQRIIKMVDVQQDPLAPPKFKHTKVPTGPPSPPPPVLRSPPRTLTAKDQEDWYIPPSVSNWKNTKGFTIALDKRVAADGRGLQEVEINDNKANLAEALYAADRSAREEIKQRAAMQQKLAERENQEKEERLRMLAKQAREERAAAVSVRSYDRTSSSVSRERDSRPNRGLVSGYSSSSGGESEEEENEEAKKRAEVRRERQREAERELRMSRMGAERRIKTMAREQNRDISEKVALGLAKPTRSTAGEAQFDSRLFSQVSTGGLGSGFNEDQIYDKSLFAAQEAIQSIYRPRGGGGDSSLGDEEAEAQRELDRFASENRFEGLGTTSSIDAREGPVEFEKDDDPFGVTNMMKEVEQSRTKKKYGLGEEGSNKRHKAE